MSTASDQSSAKQAPGTLRDWAVQNPNQIGLLRVMLFAAGLAAMGLLGARWAIPTSPSVFSPTANCSYAAEWFEPPTTAPLAVVSQTFQVAWQIQNTGSCHVWGPDVQFVRRNDALSSQAQAYPAPSVPIFSVNDNVDPINGAVVTTDLIAAAEPGTYVTEWSMVSPEGRPFGPLMRLQVQVVAVNSVPPPPTAAQPPPFLSPGLSFLVSVVYHLLPALLGMVFVLWGATRFMNKVFHLPAATSSLWHVLAFMFGGTPGYLYVHHGELNTETSDKTTQVIGGPAWLTVGEGNAVLLERGSGFSRIVGTGYHRLRPHERVRGVIDLRTHYRKGSQGVLTRDGIPVKMDVDLTFRITERNLPDDPPPTPPPPLGPYSRLRLALGLRVRHDLLVTSQPHRFSRETVRRLVYETTIMSPDTPPDWTNSFYYVRSGDITDQIANRRLDEVSAPDNVQVHPRAEVARIGLEDSRSAASAQGIEILDMTLGVIEPQDKYPHIANQIIANWKIEWERRARLLAAQAEARRTQLLEEARAEAQANMIQALNEGFRIAVGNNPENSKDVIALRYIDTLETRLTMHASDERIDLFTLLRLLRGET
jgi:regulator of protease activity HflC (stomatin/prohibitin superfamily)